MTHKVVSKALLVLSLIFSAHFALAADPVPGVVYSELDGSVVSSQGTHDAYSFANSGNYPFINFNIGNTTDGTADRLVIWVYKKSDNLPVDCNEFNANFTAGWGGTAFAACTKTTDGGLILSGNTFPIAGSTVSIFGYGSGNFTYPFDNYYFRGTNTPTATTLIIADQGSISQTTGPAFPTLTNIAFALCNGVCDPKVVTTPTVTARNPVLIIPGVMGTELSEGSQKLWINLQKNIADLGDQFMDQLEFNNDLTPAKIDIGVGEIISKVGASFFTLDYSDGLINEFKSQGYTQGTNSTDNLFTFPYDWRYGVSDSTVALLKFKIEDIRAQTGADKVDVIAHSTGGLLLKKYVMGNQTDNHIGKAVFVGVPNTGAPKAVKTLLQGDNFGNPFLADEEMKKLAANFPVVYDLSPSQEYYNKKGSYIETIDTSLFSTVKKDLSFDESNNFLINNHTLNSVALDNAHALHTANFDNFDLRTAGVDLYSIIGCKAGTLGKVIEKRQKGFNGDTIITYEQPEEVPGDGTVPLESATNLPIDMSHKYYALNASHGTMLSQNDIRQEIVNLISGSNLAVSNKITQDISNCNLNGKAVSIYSPLSIDVTDQDGNHSGIGDDGGTYNTIPNADFQVMGDHKFVYLPSDEGQTYTIKVKGTGDGTFTLKNQNIINNVIAGTEVFSNVPVTTNLSGALNLGTTSTLALDTNSDGTVDSTVTPSAVIDADQSLDLIPPITTAVITGTQGQSGYYRSSVSIGLTGVDPTVDNDPANTSGILKTNYNLDGAGYVVYTGTPVQVLTEGPHTLKFFSTDKAGNNEVEQSLTFTIDKTAPEMSIVFNPTTKDLQFTGTDNISKDSDLVVLDQDDVITITDQAGNIVVIKLKNKNRKSRYQAGIKSIMYNGVASDISKNELNFSWKFSKTQALSSLTQHVKSKKDFNITAEYENGVTSLSGKDQNGKIQKKINGVVLLKITTNKGDLNWDTN